MSDMEERKLTEHESLDLINQMIVQAKHEIQDNGLGWLLWGWMIFLASLSTFFLASVESSYLFIGWNAFGLIAIPLMVYQVIRDGRSTRVRTYVDDILRYVDIAFSICIFVIIISMNIPDAVHPNEGFGYFLMVYAFLMLVQGGALKFRPLFIGAVINWAGAIAIFINQEFKYDMLITAIAVFIGYIIPGYILRRQHAKKMKVIN